jgi:hypothetical protein
MVMWGRRRARQAPDELAPRRLRDALRRARIESAERTAVIVDLRDAEIARLEILNEALDPLFAEIPDTIDIFDRAIARADKPRLWIDLVAHVDMGRDNRTYRFMQDSRYGRQILAETTDVAVVVEAVSKYIARRIVERERALAADEHAARDGLAREAQLRRRWRWRSLRAFLYGLLLGVAAVIAAFILLVLRLQQ